MVCSEETGFLRDIERLMQRRVERVVVEGFEPSSGMARFDATPPPAACGWRRTPRAGADLSHYTQTEEFDPARMRICRTSLTDYVLTRMLFCYKLNP
ncbi:hypothetical protein, partial [Deinococcus sp.]|uniref:hypothetical protein n=1 Tax=Deinococcus sp. TaxID=47478 RepID=UPI00286E1E0A